MISSGGGIMYKLETMREVLLMVEILHGLIQTSYTKSKGILVV